MSHAHTLKTSFKKAHSVKPANYNATQHQHAHLHSHSHPHPHAHSHQRSSCEHKNSGQLNGNHKTIPDYICLGNGCFVCERGALQSMPENTNWKKKVQKSIVTYQLSHPVEQVQVPNNFSLETIQQLQPAESEKVKPFYIYDEKLGRKRRHDPWFAKHKVMKGNPVELPLESPKKSPLIQPQESTKRKRLNVNMKSSMVVRKSQKTSTSRDSSMNHFGALQNQFHHPVNVTVGEIVQPPNPNNCDNINSNLIGSTSHCNFNSANYSLSNTNSSTNSIEDCHSASSYLYMTNPSTTLCEEAQPQPIAMDLNNGNSNNNNEMSNINGLMPLLSLNNIGSTIQFDFFPSNSGSNPINSNALSNSGSSLLNANCNAASIEEMINNLNSNATGNMHGFDEYEWIMGVLAE